MGKIVLYLAMSVDGYIADEQGGVNWLEGDGSQMPLVVILHFMTRWTPL